MLMGSPFRLLAALAWTCDASTLLVPAYWWAATDATGACTTADFYALAAAGAAAVAVVNPDNGPIDASDANFAAFAACAALLYGADPALDAAAFVAAAYDAGVDYVYVTDRPSRRPGTSCRRSGALVAAVSSGDDGDDDACGDSSSWSYGVSGKGCAKLLEDPSRCKKKSYDKVMGYEACPYGLCDAASDSDSWYANGKPKNSCTWISKSPDARCGKKDDAGVRATYACAATCGSGEDHSADSCLADFYDDIEASLCGGARRPGT
ncbi:hypothetical protein SO694_000283105 [Aureococcus anophagefferens]|uniref:Subtilisin n=1 Tax=Aureococcus anophagefferens TaxID=44056 RepID=A0ABR1FVM4_AURAN